MKILLAVLLLNGNLLFGSGEPERQTLKGASTVYVLVEQLNDDAKQYAALTEQTLRTDAELKLRFAGVKVIDRSERRQYPQSSCLYLNVNVVKAPNNLFQSGLRVFAVGAHVSFLQDAYLERDRSFVSGAATWTVSKVSFMGIEKVQLTRDDLKDLVDTFVDDWLAVNPKQ